jgi:hypothetical protein
MQRSACVGASSRIPSLLLSSGDYNSPRCVCRLDSFVEDPVSLTSLTTPFGRRGLRVAEQGLIVRTAVAWVGVAGVWVTSFSPARPGVTHGLGFGLSRSLTCSFLGGGLGGPRRADCGRAGAAPAAARVPPTSCRSASAPSCHPRAIHVNTTTPEA